MRLYPQTLLWRTFLLVAALILLPPAGARLDVAAFLTAPRASLPPEASLTAAVRVEREEGR